jgi:hypothetical protein
MVRGNVIFVANYSQISTLKKTQLQVERKKGGPNDESSIKASSDGWDGPKGSPLMPSICLSKPSTF